jgi:hypothetical protein
MDLYTFGPLQQQHTHKNVESCGGGGHCCLFWLGSKKKTKSTDNKGESKSSEWGKKMRKEKSGARTLGL